MSDDKVCEAGKGTCCSAGVPAVHAFRTAGVGVGVVVVGWVFAWV